MSCGTSVNNTPSSLSLFYFPLLPPHPTLLAFPLISSLIICSKPVPFPLQWVEPLRVSEPRAQRLWGEQHPAMQQQQQPLHARLLGPHPQRRAVREGNSAEGLPLTPTLQPSVPRSKRMRHEHHTSAFQRPWFQSVFFFSPVSSILLIICHYYCSFVHLNPGCS